MLTAQDLIGFYWLRVQAMHGRLFAGLEAYGQPQLLLGATGPVQISLPVGCDGVVKANTWEVCPNFFGESVGLNVEFLALYNQLKRQGTWRHLIPSATHNHQLVLVSMPIIAKIAWEEHLWIQAVLMYNSCKRRESMICGDCRCVAMWHGRISGQPLCKWKNKTLCNQDAHSSIHIHKNNPKMVI